MFCLKYKPSLSLYTYRTTLSLHSGRPDVHNKSVGESRGCEGDIGGVSFGHRRHDQGMIRPFHDPCVVRIQREPPDAPMRLPIGAVVEHDRRAALGLPHVAGAHIPTLPPPLPRGPNVLGQLWKSALWGKSYF